MNMVEISIIVLVSSAGLDRGDLCEKEVDYYYCKNWAQLYMHTNSQYLILGCSQTMAHSYVLLKLQQEKAVTMNGMPKYTYFI